METWLCVVLFILSILVLISMMRDVYEFFNKDDDDDDFDY